MRRAGQMDAAAPEAPKAPTWPHTVISAIERIGSRREGRASTSAAFRPSSCRRMGSGHRHHVAAAPFGFPRLEFLGVEFPAGPRLPPFALQYQNERLSSEHVRNVAPRRFIASAARRSTASSSYSLIMSRRSRTICRREIRLLTAELGQAHAELDQHALSDRRGSQARKAEDREPLVLFLVPAKRPFDLDRELHKRIDLGNNRQYAGPRTEQPGDDRADVEGRLPRQSGRTAFGDRAFRQPLPVSHAKPEPAAFAMDAGG